MFETVDQLLERIRRSEDSLLELKELHFAGTRIKAPRRDDLADEMAAFANSLGGMLVLGVDDRSKEILGIAPDRMDDAERFVTKISQDSIDPSIDPVIRRIQLPDTMGRLRPVIVLEIERSLFVHSSPSGYLRRVGSFKRKMSPDQLARLFQQRSQSRMIRFDEAAVPRTLFDSADVALTDRFLSSRIVDDRARLAEKLAVVTRDHSGSLRLTVAGVLLTTTRPDRWLSHAFIQAVAYRGRTVSDALDEANYQLDAEDIVGPLDVQVAEACRFVSKNQRVRARKSRGRTDIPDYDMTAVFESLVNAVAHRDYSFEQSKIRLRMFSDRLELYSPGELVNTMTPETLPYRRATRNEAVTSLLARCLVPEGIRGLETTRATLMDRRGEGVPIILERSEKISGRLPVYRSLDESELQLTIFAAQ